MFLERDALPMERNVRIDVSHSAQGDTMRPARRPRYTRYKAFVETGLTVLLLLPAVPVVLAAVLLVKLTSRGPIFYLQRRVGRGGEPYTIFKIRTMFHDCERL